MVLFLEHISLSCKVKPIKHPFPYLQIEDMYDQEELRYIWQELDFLTYSQKLKPPKETGSAEKNGKLLKNNFCLFLDDLYNDRNISNILTVNRKLFSERYLSEFSNLNHAYNLIYHTNFDATLISYYANGGYYEPHKDKAVYTALTWLYKEPKKFYGGDFNFDEYDIKIKIKNNMTIIFPSFVTHSVDEVFMNSEEIDGMGRYCMTQFMFLNSNSVNNF